MSHINIYEIKSRFSHYARQVLKGHSFVIAYRNKPFALLSPLPGQGGGKSIRFGLLKGRFDVPEDFNSPLTEFEADYLGSDKELP